MQGIVNYDPSCPSRILIEDLKKVLNSFAEGLEKMDIVNATQNTCSKAEACLVKEMALWRRACKIRKGSRTKGKGKI